MRYNIYYPHNPFFQISQMPECSGLMTEMALGFEDFVFATPYHTYWRFWYRNFVTIFFPFFMLAYFNIRIVKALSHQQKQSCADLINNTIEQSKRKKTTRSATRTMILVVCCYLISNIMNVLLTIWEHVDKTSLAEKYDRFDEEKFIEEMFFKWVEFQLLRISIGFCFTRNKSFMCLPSSNLSGMPSSNTKGVLLYFEAMDTVSFRRAKMSEFGKDIIFLGKLSHQISKYFRVHKHLVHLKMFV